MQIRNFLFHRVSDQTDMLWPPMRVALFEKIIKHLSKKYTVIHLEHFMLQNEKRKTKKPLASISFDDGYKDNIENAAPALKKNNCPASFYVVTDCIDNNTPTWTYQLDYAIANSKINAIVLDKDLSKLPHGRFDISNKERKMQFAIALKPHLKKLDHKHRNEILKNVLEQLHAVEMPRIMMNWTDSNELMQAGFEIGSHGKTHAMLGTSLEHDELNDELVQSAKAIEIHTGRFPVTISYPVGSYNHQTIAAAKQAGYKIGLAVKQRFYETEHDSIFEIPRVELYNESWVKTQLRMNGLLEKIKSLKR